MIRRHGFYSHEPVAFTDHSTAARGEPWPTLVFDVADESVERFERLSSRERNRTFIVPPHVANTFFPIVDQLPAQPE
jgi:hypothetical protein